MRDQTENFFQRFHLLVQHLDKPVQENCYTLYRTTPKFRRLQPLKLEQKIILISESVPRGRNVRIGYSKLSLIFQPHFSWSIHYPAMSV